MCLNMSDHVCTSDSTVKLNIYEHPYSIHLFRNSYIFTFFCIQVFPLWCVYSHAARDVFLWRNCIYFYAHDFLHSGISTLVCAFPRCRPEMSIFGGIVYIFMLMIFCIQVFPLWCVHSHIAGDVSL